MFDAKKKKIQMYAERNDFDELLSVTFMNKNENPMENCKSAAIDTPAKPVTPIDTDYYNS